MNDKIITVSDRSFDNDVMKSGIPVLVEFRADWSGQSKTIAPILDDAADEYAGRATIAKMDVDQNPTVPARYGVRNIPTLGMFKNGELGATRVGGLSKVQLKEFIEAQL